MVGGAAVLVGVSSFLFCLSYFFLCDRHSACCDRNACRYGMNAMILPNEMKLVMMGVHRVVIRGRLAVLGLGVISM